MAKKSIDFSKIKGVLFEKGERIALVAVAALTVLILVAGTFGPMAPATSPPANAGGPTFDAAINSKVKELEQKIATSTPGDMDIPKVPKALDRRVPIAGVIAALAPRTGPGQFLALATRIAASRPPDPPGSYRLIDDPTFADWAPLFNPDTDIPNERVNPTILTMGSKVDGGIREVQVDYFPAPALVLDANVAKKTYVAVVSAEGRGSAPSVQLEPKRMVMIHMTFPIKEQLEFYREALRYPTVKQLLGKGEAPRFLGLNIWKQELTADGKKTTPVPLYQYDAKEDRIVVHSPALDDFFRRMRIDVDGTRELAAYLGPNMVTPLPDLASVGKGEIGYPPVRLTGLPQPTMADPEAAPKEKKNGGGFGLGKRKDLPKGSKEAALTFDTKKIKELPADIQARLNGNYNVFDPQGRPLSKDKEAKEDRKFPVFNNPYMQKKSGKSEDGKGDEEVTRLLSRFIDVDAKVGKTYRYWVQVRVASPNFGRTEDVAHLGIGKPAELLSDWAATPWITVPPEAYFFAVDQLALADKTEGTPARDGTGVDKDKVDADRTVVQLHRWLERSGSRPIGDWAVAERIAVHRGDLIGRSNIRVEVPEWNPKKARFELGFYSEGRAKSKVPGIPVDFKLGNPPPILVDFQGGKHDYRLGKVTIWKETAAVEMLVLTPEGSLVVRNSRIDSDPATDTGRLRFLHYWRWRNRVRAVREATPASGSTYPKK